MIATLKPLFLIMISTICIISFSSCGDGGGAAVETKEERAYFSLVDFFDKEIKRLEGEDKEKLEKRVILNGMEEIKTMTNEQIDWATELSVFKQADINRKAWLDKYEVIEQIESTKTGEDIHVTEYKALDPDLKTRFIKLYYKDKTQAPLLVEIRNETKNMIYKGYEKLRYKRGERYYIENVQKVVMRNLDQMIIDGNW